jgi:serine phosphatase RsbU (regulator of sigma subunit)
MSVSYLSRELDGTVTRQEHPYLRLNSVDVFVRDYERSLRFYVERLGFELAFDAHLQSGVRCVAVSPPNGTAVLTLIQPEPDSPNYARIGKSTCVMFVTEDVAKTYSEWSARGVKFRHTPRLRRIKYEEKEPAGQGPVWGQVFTRFEDVDGNSFSLASFDEVSRAVEAQRRAAIEKLEAERRIAHELDIARRVQARLFPQTLPPCSTLEYAGACAQARQVGGDYFDFLSLGQGRLGLVIGDIAGKGIAAALLMANLQANLRSQCLGAVDDPRRFLESVNRLFFENTDPSAYATLFFAEYSEMERRLRYVNCGHLPGLLLRSGGDVERLESTSTVMGLFPGWECSIGECELADDDILALYTDGVTEACNEAGEEFCEEGVLSAVKRHCSLPPKQMVDAIVSEVLAFSAREQYDDITLLAAKCKGAHAMRGPFGDL